MIKLKILTIISSLLVLNGCAVWHELDEEQKFYIAATVPLGLVLAAGKHNVGDER